MSTATTAQQEPPLSGAMLWVAAIFLSLGNFLAVLNMTIANVAVPTIAGNLGASGSQGTWIITSYSVAEAILVPLTGWLTNRFGAVPLFVAACALFGVFSAVCGLSGSFDMLVLARVAQGMAGGPIMPMSQTLLLRIFPKKQAAAATGLWAVTSLVAPVVGPDSRRRPVRWLLLELGVPDQCAAGDHYDHCLLGPAETI